MRSPRWIVPLGPGQVVAGSPSIRVSIHEAERGSLKVKIESVNADAIYDGIQMVTPLVACQLGQALQDAAKWCGQEMAKREARKR